jgi:hypothetical protein
MANKFDSSVAPQGEPQQIVAGDFAQWKRTDLIEDYPLASHSAEYVARISSGGYSEFKVAASEVDGSYLFAITSSTSAAFLPGTYRWQLEITQTSSGNRVVVDSGDMVILPDMDNNQTDSRSHAEIMVTKIEGLLSGKADSDVSSYSIAGRSLTKLGFQELVDARDYYRREVNNQKNKELLSRGKGGGATIKVRF